MDCGLQHFWRGKKHAKWLKELFAEKDDESWLKGLFNQKEISEEQFTWLRDLFAKKSAHDKVEANKWWQNVANGNKFGENFDPDSMPDWLKEASKRENEGNWSWNSTHGKKGHHVHKSSWSWSSKEAGKDGENVPADKAEQEHQSHSTSHSHSHSRSWSWSSKHGEKPANEELEGRKGKKWSWSSEDLEPATGEDETHGHWSKKWREAAQKHFEEAKDKASDLSKSTKETKRQFMKDALHKLDLNQKLDGGRQRSQEDASSEDEPLLI
jgi:hypothetical protein